MHAIEFETIPHQHIIRLPDNIPDGVSLRVLLLSQAPLSTPSNRNLKTLLASVVEGMTDANIARNLRKMSHCR